MRARGFREEIELAPADYALLTTWGWRETRRGLWRDPQDCARTKSWRDALRTIARDQRRGDEPGDVA